MKVAQHVKNEIKVVDTESNARSSIEKQEVKVELKE